MSKHDFTSDPVLTPSHQNLLYLTDGGHKHDGVDADGHAGKINLAAAAEVTGNLPSDNVANNSTVTGSTATAALNALATAIGSETSRAEGVEGTPTGANLKADISTVQTNLDKVQSASAKKILATFVLWLTGAAYDDAGNSANLLSIPLSSIDAGLDASNTIIVGLKISITADWHLVPGYVGAGNISAKLVYPMSGPHTLDIIIPDEVGWGNWTGANVFAIVHKIG
jgi:hypothetical protein